MIWQQMLGFLASFLGLVMVVGAGIILVLETFGAEFQVAAGIVLALVLVSLGAVSALASKNREWIANPYW
ncbi:hypothetical protein [Halorientalis marina]|jgi:drug/metabolite transporter (DMT)-like permease|uniref:hypothetical protein n=1 Tax=Halorientalis marina TaxID=2931976 RepID=UPI001FF499E9|nr:hypothetical protein [Halorientalis marina]